VDTARGIRVNKNPQAFARGFRPDRRRYRVRDIGTLAWSTSMPSPCFRAFITSDELLGLFLGDRVVRLSPARREVHISVVPGTQAPISLR